jgi:hypothetical protein
MEKIMNSKLFLISLVLFSCENVFAAEKEPPKEDVISKYLVDITGGAVSAANLLNVDNSLVTNIQTSQDLVVAIRPFSSDEQKAGFGISFTPARSDLGLFSMSGKRYLSNKGYQFIGNLTFSYAQNHEDIGAIKYKKTAVSIDSYLYLNQYADPIHLGNAAFLACHKNIEVANASEIERITLNPTLTPERKNELISDLTTQNAANISPCIDENVKAALAKAKWNSNRVSISYGQSRINAPGADTLSLGKYLTLNAMIGLSDKSALNISFRKSKDVLDASTLGTTGLSFSNSNLAAIRYTYGDETGKKMRGLVEVSNANKYSGAATNGVFLYALGFDKKIMDGLWLGFRLGRNRSITNDKIQTTGLLNISLQPSLTPFGK